MALGKFAFDLIISLLTVAIEEGTTYAGLSFFQQRKITSRVENATAEVVEPLIPFLQNEGIDSEKQRLLIRTCVNELKPFTQKPEGLFQGSLNGQ